MNVSVKQSRTEQERERERGVLRIFRNIFHSFLCTGGDRECCCPTNENMQNPTNTLVDNLSRFRSDDLHHVSKPSPGVG